MVLKFEKLLSVLIVALTVTLFIAHNADVVYGQEGLHVKDGGNVGIGTTTPDESLHVIGSVKIDDGTQSAGKVLTSDANGVGNWKDPSPYIKLHDSKPPGTDGGTFTTGGWVTRDIAEDQDTGNNVSVTSNVITLEAGTYDCFIRCPAFFVYRHQARLRNTTDGTTTIAGGSMYAPQGGNGVCNDSIIQGRFTIASDKAFEIQHRCQATQVPNGLGVKSDFGENEIYTIAEFWKVD